jgi:hypothetical protein
MAAWVESGHSSRGEMIEAMNYTVKLAIFPPWKAPTAIEEVGTFATLEEATAAGERSLTPIAEREMTRMSDRLTPISASDGGLTVTTINVPEEAVHGYVIYDCEGIELFNWTTLDVAVERTASESD